MAARKTRQQDEGTTGARAPPTEATAGSEADAADPATTATSSLPLSSNLGGLGVVWRFVRPRTLVKLLVWAALQFLFFRLEFGLVFFIASCFYWVWDSMSSSSSSSSADGVERLSAYSVFNRGVNALPGTLNANEFDNMMRGGFAPPAGAGNGAEEAAARRRDDVADEEEDEAAQRAALASLKHRKKTAEQQQHKTKKTKSTAATAAKTRTYASSSSSSSSSSTSAAPKPLVFDSDLQALLRSVAKP